MIYAASAFLEKVSRYSFVAALIIVIPACAINPVALIERTPDVTYPFDLSQTGSVSTFDFNAGGNLNRTYGYSFELRFSNPSGDAATLRRLDQLLGVGANPTSQAIEDAHGENILARRGAEIPVKLTITRRDGKTETTIYDKVLRQLYPGGGNQYFVNVGIDSVRMEPGPYTVRLEALRAISEFSSTPIQFRVYVPHK